MNTRVGINGFGRMGRLAIRIGWGRPGIEFVHINEPRGGPAVAAHLLKYDSIHGRWPNRVRAASCTTNCLAPIVKVIHDSLRIRHGVITTIHDMTNTQHVVDVLDSDLRRARSASLSLIPTTTGSASAISLIYPELQGRLNGLAVRVPLLNASITDAVFEVGRATTTEEVNGLFRHASNSTLKGILGYEELPLVSVDFRGDARSAIIDAGSTMVVDGTQVKVLAWYDNESGYVHRMVELVQKVGHGLRDMSLEGGEVERKSRMRGG